MRDEIEIEKFVPISTKIMVCISRDRLLENEIKATAYDSKEVQDVIECDRIESQLLTSIFKLEYQFFFNEVTISMWINPDDFKLFTEKTKLEALTKALEWVEG